MSKWEEICEANPQGYDEDDARVYYDNQTTYWDTVDPDEFWDEFQENYQGCWGSDEDFAQEMAEMLGFKASNEWPASCIDWKQAARELMYDYWSDQGVYFRS